SLLPTPLPRSTLFPYTTLFRSSMFTRFGTSFREYHDLSVEASYLYLENRFMQYAHARCLLEELEAVGARETSQLPARIQWPEGLDRKSTRLNSSHVKISYAVFC